jgi:hypothetical protein
MGTDFKSVPARLACGLFMKPSFLENAGMQVFYAEYLDMKK